MNDLTNIPDRLRARAQDFLDEQPKAIDLRFEGTCPVCRRDYLISWKHKDLLDNSLAPAGEEWCGDVCLACNFGGATSRPIVPDETV